MSEIIFVVEKDLEGGVNASALGYSIFAQSEDMDELRNNIKDALKCHFEAEQDVPKVIRLHMVTEEVFSYA